MKSNRMKLVTAGIGVAVLLAIAAVAEAPGGMGHWHGRCGGPMGMFGAYLNLSDAQRTQIRQIFEGAKSGMQPLWQQQRQNHKAMMDLITSGSFDQAKAQAIANQSAQLHAQMELQHAQLTSQAYQVLTADQKAKFTERLAQRQQRFEERMQRHMQDNGAQQTPDQ